MFKVFTVGALKKSLEEYPDDMHVFVNYEQETDPLMSVSSWDVNDEGERRVAVVLQAGAETENG